MVAMVNTLPNLNKLEIFDGERKMEVRDLILKKKRLFLVYQS